jgi:F0F1-type ATP synthase epsilon subunit
VPEEEHDISTVDPAADKLAAEQTAVANAMGDGTKMHVKIYAPFKVYFDDDALSISAINDTGPFDILPKHHNFMTLLNAGDVTVRTERGEEKVKITRGIMHVKADEVVVFLDV